MSIVIRPAFARAEATAVPATPVARRMAEGAEIDLREIKGTGSAGAHLFASTGERALARSGAAA